MVHFTNVKTYSDTRKYLESQEKNRLVYVYFFGTKNEAGESWCPDCNEAEPLVMEAFNKYADRESEALIVDVGDRATWKDPLNVYRQDADMRLTSIPTLMRWNGKERLSDGPIVDTDSLKTFFEKGKA